MAITLDANLGTFVQASATGTVSLTTTNAVSAGAFIVIGIAAFDIAANLTGVSGGGLTWTIDKQGRPPGGGGNPVAEFVAIASAQAPSGLAASTVITATWSDTTVQARIIGGTSFMGVATSSPVDGTPTGPTFTDTQVTPWATASYPIAAGSLLFTVCYAESTDTGSTPTSPSVEAWQTQDLANDYGAAANYRIESSAGSYTSEGTWGGISKWTNVAVAYKAAAAEGITFVQDFTEYADSTDTVEVPVPVGGCAAGNLLIVAVQSFTDEGVLNTVEDTQGNTYTIRQQRSGSPGLNIAVADCILDTALTYPADVITVTNNDFTSGLAAVCLEYSGVDPTPFDQTTDNGQYSNSITSGTVTTTQADELLFGFHMILATETWTPTGSFSVKDNQSLFGIKFISQDRIVASTGTYASTGTTVGTDNSLSIITTYKAATEAGPTIEYSLDTHNVTPMTWR